MKSGLFCRKLQGSFRCGVRAMGLVVFLLSISVGTVQGQTWYKKKVWIARHDSIPVYRQEKIGSDTIQLICGGKGTEISPATLSYDQKWIIFPTGVGAPNGYISVSDLDYYLEGNRNYEVSADSVVGTLEVIYPASFQGRPRSVSQTFYKGDVIKMNRAYPDHYAYQFQGFRQGDAGGRQDRLPLAFRGRIDKNALTPTQAQTTTFFTGSDSLMNAVQDEYDALHADERRAEKTGRVLFIVVSSLVVAGCLVGFVYLNVPLLRRYLFDRSKSNAVISATILIGSALLMYIAGSALWILTEGVLALVLAAVCVLLFFVAVRHAEYRLEGRCRKCANYSGVNYVGKTKDGTKWEYDQQYDCIVEYRWEGDTLVEKRIDRNQWLRHRYQMYAFHYKCPECGHTWKVRYKGELVASQHRTEEETEETRYRR